MVSDRTSERIIAPGVTPGRWLGRADLLAAGLFLLVTLSYFLPALLAGNAEVLSSKGTDTWNQYFYWRQFGFHALARGELPLWNPYVFGGMPFIAGMQSAIFYPLNALFLFLDTPAAINVSIALHFFLAALFTYLFCRYKFLSSAASCVAALAFACGAPFFLHVYPGHLSNLATVPWFPLTLLGMEAFLRNRTMRYAILSAVPLALQVLAGHPQYLFYGALATGFYFIIEAVRTKQPRELPYFCTGFCLFVLVAIALSAVQLLPTLELARLSVRQGLTYDWVSTFSFPPENFMTMLFPRLFGDYGVTPYWGQNYFWEASLYIGVVPLCFAIVALILNRSPSVKLFALLGALALLVALGRHTPLLWLLYRWVAGFNLFRGVSKIVFLYSFSAALLAGYGLDALVTRGFAEPGKLRRLGSALVICAMIVAVLGAAIYVADESSQQELRSYIGNIDHDIALPAVSESFLKTAQHTAVASIWQSSALLALLGATLLVFAQAGNRLPRAAFTWSVVVLTVLDLWIFGQRYIVSFNPAELRMDPAVKAFLRRDPEPARWTVPRLPDVNMGMIEGLENAGGYEAIVLKNYSELVNAALGWPLDHPTMVMGITAVSPVFDMLNVRYYVVSAANYLGDPRLTQQFDDGRYKIYRNANALPRSFIVHGIKFAATREEELGLLGSPGFNPRRTALVDQPISGVANDSRITSPKPRIIRRSLTEVEIRADASAPGLLVLSDVYYPGWKAWVDGKESRVLRVNHALRGVFVSRGSHEIVFRYDPVSFKAGALISLISLLLLAFWLPLGYLKRRGSKPSTPRLEATYHLRAGVAAGKS